MTLNVIEVIAGVPNAYYDLLWITACKMETWGRTGDHNSTAGCSTAAVVHQSELQTQLYNIKKMIHGSRKMGCCFM